MLPKESLTPTHTNELSDIKPGCSKRHRRWYHKSRHCSRGGHVDPSSNINDALTRNQREALPNTSGSAVYFAQSGSHTESGDVTANPGPYFNNQKTKKSDDKPQDATSMAQRGSFHCHQRPKRHKHATRVALRVQLDNLDNLPPRARELTQQLIDNTYECLSCLELIKIDDAIWCCSCCFNMCHLRCIQRWACKGASSSRLDEAYSSYCCPQCRTEYTESVKQYKCFCKRMINPPYDPFVIPHSCGSICGKARKNGCPHPCALQCHPGPCSECHVTIGPLACPCGSITYSYRCGEPIPHVTCDNFCGKVLSCNKHHCERTCHIGECGDCTKLITVTCPCGKETGEVQCSSAVFLCGKSCGKPLTCGNHNCTLDCHAGDCPPCEEDPSIVQTCPCGAAPLSQVRQSCLDPIPRCGRICSKTLKCGLHNCTKECHTGPCMPCVARLETSCRCRQIRKLVNCTEADNFQCTRACGTRLSCGRHYCKVVCCPHRNKTNVSQHECRLACGRKLKCGHTCSEPCHRGACPSCVYFITEPLYCRCGRTMLMPPQPCDAKPPDCPHLCEVRPACGHPPVPHRCHYGDCPVCTYLVSKKCVGGHMVVENTPCWQPNVTCPQKCRKLHPLCRHPCLRPCHGGPCMDEQHPCTHTCINVHQECGHACERPCHVGSECPPCQHLMTRTCECGRIRRRVPCVQFRAQIERHRQKHLVEPFEIPCDKDCLYEARLTILSALAKGATHTSSLSPETPSSLLKSSGCDPLIPFFYSIQLWEHISEKGVAVVEQIEKQLKNFLAGSESLVSLPPAHPEKRMLIHSIAAFYKVEVESVDHGRHRSCLLKRNPLSHMPPILLSEAIKSPELYDPRLFFWAVVESSRTGSVPLTSASFKAPWETNGSDSRMADEDHLQRMSIKGSTKGKSLLPQLGIYVFGEAVNERTLMQLLSPELVGSFVFGSFEECDDRNKALLVFTSPTKQQEGCRVFRQKAAPFQFWVPIQ
ncbi:unnamed protein product [Phytomonas sp. EM1]|nr:unnamed protein product [Phytomonas sp. EM1]|eukprot:CCW65577.1 unnamed protein product [Phytomonas sp. isolate EM1]